MAKISGLRKTKTGWVVDKRINGERVYQRIEKCSAAQAEAEYHEIVRRHQRPAAQAGITWRTAATHYLQTQTKKSLSRDALDLADLDKWIGDIPIDQIHDQTLAPYVRHRQELGRADGTINRALAVIGRILVLSARSWRHANGEPWLTQAPPLLSRVTGGDKRAPYVATATEERLLMESLAPHLQAMALHALNTGCREQEVVQLRWEWERRVSELNCSVFLLPAWICKNGKERIVPINDIAMRNINLQRGKHPEFVFTQDGEPVTRIYNSGWKGGRERAADKLEAITGQPAPWGFRHMRVHDMRHTCGSRLRALGVSNEDRGDILGHSNGNMTTHYSAAEIGNLIHAANKLCQERAMTPTLMAVS